MMLNKGVLAAGILVMGGFCGGFLVSKGSGEVFGMKPVHQAFSKKGKSGNGDEVLAAGIYNAAKGDGDGEGAEKHPKLDQGGGGGAGAGEAAAAGSGAAASGAGAGGDGATQAAAGGGGGEGQGSQSGGASGNAAPGAQAAGSSGDADGHGTKPGQTVPLTGTQASTFLTGNTVDVGLPNGTPHLVYYAQRGLKAEGQERSFVVKPWNPKSATLCEPGSDGVLVCRPLQVRGETGDHAAGARIGMLLVAGERWVPIYKGDLLGLPAHVPFVDSTVAEANADAVPAKPTAKGQAALHALVGHATAIVPSEGSADQPTGIVYFADDGRRVTLTRPDEGADLSEGLAVAVGQWTFVNDTFCQSDGGLGSARSCFKPEAWGAGTIRLVAAKKGKDLKLNILAETPKPHLEAAN